jgi:hypothetical protein
MWRLISEEGEVLYQETHLLPFLQAILYPRRSQMLVFERQVGNRREVDGHTLHSFLGGSMDMKEAPELWQMICTGNVVRILFSRGEIAETTRPTYPSLR